MADLVMILSCTGVAASSSTRLLAQAPTFVEYAVPTARSQPYGITSGPDKAIWFTEQIGGKIGKITTAGVLTEYALPGGASTPQSIASGPDGALWFTVAQKVGKITTSGTITLYSLTTTGFSPNFITPGPDGALWFTDGLQDRDSAQWRKSPPFRLRNDMCGWFRLL